VNRKSIISAGVAIFALTACGKQAESKAADSAVADAADAAVEAQDALPEKALTPTERAVAFHKLATENLAKSQAFLAENKTREGVKETASGLQYVVLEEGPEGGATPVSTDLVVFQYAATTQGGVEFDSSRARGAAPQVPVNAIGMQTPGLAEGLQLMSEGDRYRFFLPPELGFGDRVAPGSPVGPNETLIFDIDLIKVKNPAKNLAEATAFLAENAKKDGVKTTPSGLQYEVITKGKGGKSPRATDTVRVHYQGTLINGTEFDSSYARGEPIEFPLNGVIAGWTEGLQLMNEGDKFRFFIPPNLGYGERGGPGGAIGPNEALIFEVELIKVK